MKPVACVLAGLIMLSGCQSALVNQSRAQSPASPVNSPSRAYVQTNLTDFLSVTAPPQNIAAPPQGMTSGPSPAVYATAGDLATHSEITAPPQNIAAPPQGMTAPPQGMTAPPQGITAPPMSIYQPLESAQFQAYDRNGDNHWNKSELQAYKQDWNSQYQGFATQAVNAGSLLNLSIDNLFGHFDFNQDGLLNFSEAHSLHDNLRTSLQQTVSAAVSTPVTAPVTAATQTVAQTAAQTVANTVDQVTGQTTASASDSSTSASSSVSGSVSATTDAASQATNSLVDTVTGTTKKIL